METYKIKNSKSKQTFILLRQIGDKGLFIRLENSAKKTSFFFKNIGSVGSTLYISEMKDMEFIKTLKVFRFFFKVVLALKWTKNLFFGEPVGSIFKK